MCGQFREDVVEYVLGKDRDAWIYRACSPCMDKKFPGVREKILDDERAVMERIGGIK